jgi:heptosyltransferase-2
LATSEFQASAYLGVGAATPGSSTPYLPSMKSIVCGHDRLASGACRPRCRAAGLDRGRLPGTPPGDFPGQENGGGNRFNRLLILNIGRVGDTILSNAILDSAFGTYARVDYLCGKNNAPIVQSDSRFNKVIIWDNSLAGFARILKAALQCRYDALIGLKDSRSRTNLLLAALFRGTIKTGWNGTSFEPFDQDIKAVCQRTIHRVEMMRRIGQLAGLEGGVYEPSLVVPAQATLWFKRHYANERRFIFLNVSATDSRRMWPVEHWVDYVQGCGFGDETIFVNGLPKHQPIVKQLCKSLRGAVAFQPRGFLDVAAAITEARLVLTVDTGVVHACSALNRPIVALFCAGSSGVELGPLSERRLMIQPVSGRYVTDIDPKDAIGQTLAALPVEDVLVPG